MRRFFFCFNFNSKFFDFNLISYVFDVISSRRIFRIKACSPCAARRPVRRSFSFLATAVYFYLTSGNLFAASPLIPRLRVFFRIRKPQSRRPTSPLAAQPRAQGRKARKHAPSFRFIQRESFSFQIFYFINLHQTASRNSISAADKKPRGQEIVMQRFPSRGSRTRFPHSRSYVTIARDIVLSLFLSHSGRLILRPTSRLLIQLKQFSPTRWIGVCCGLNV